MDNTLIAKNIYKSYKENEVLKGLNLTIEPSKIYGLIGRNGVGKTTLLGILTAQNACNSGEITYKGEQVWENHNTLKDMCFSRELATSTVGGYQNTNTINFYLKAGSLFYESWDKEYAERLLKEFGLKKKKKISQLSKGQASMVTILIALASCAPLTIFDEPTAGLDIVMRDRFYKLVLEDYSKTGRTFIISTHVIDEATSIFEEVIILDKGVIIEKAPTDELLSQFAMISGHVDAVERATRGLTVLTKESLGKHTGVVVRGITENFQTNEDVDVTSLSLQRVFVALCGDSVLTGGE